MLLGPTRFATSIGLWTGREMNPFLHPLICVPIWFDRNHMNKPETPFTPVPLRYRHDGWTAQRQVAFLKALAATSCVADACKAVGMSRDSAYDLRARPSAIAFRAAWLA